jgi:hypothetical protein
MRYGWPEAAYLVSTLGSRDEFCRFLVQLVENCTGFVWNFLPFCIEPIVERIKSEDGLASDATPALRTPLCKIEANRRWNLYTIFRGATLGAFVCSTNL